MTTISFDTHAFYIELIESGLAEKTADALTKAVTRIELAKLEELVVKRDLKELELKVQAELDKTKAELIRWVVGVVVGVALLQTTLIVGLIFRLADKI